MKKLLITSIISGALVITPMANAQDSAEITNRALSDQHEEELGFGVGVVIGGILGGPAGAFITGVAGNFLMKNINNKDELVAVKAEQQSQSESYNQQIAQLQQQMRQAEIQYQQELLALEQAQSTAGALQASNLMMSLQFNTGSSDVPDYYQQQIQALANILNQHTDLRIDLSGYTDLLGDSERNQELSMARANSVKRRLVALGVQSDRIDTSAFGDKFPVVANAQQQSSFYDRRVMINIKQPGDQVAKN